MDRREILWLLEMQLLGYTDGTDKSLSNFNLFTSILHHFGCRHHFVGIFLSFFGLCMKLLA